MTWALCKGWRLQAKEIHSRKKEESSEGEQTQGVS